MSETAYKEGAFVDEQSKDIPVKVHIISPSTLPEGYVFEAEVGAPGNKKTISVEVPEGGVVEGQVFLVPLPADFAVGEPQLNIPTGRWKDGLFDLANAGICHPSLWCACCCTQIGMGQVMQRMRLNWLGDIGYDASTKKTFKVVLALLVSYTVFSMSLEILEGSKSYYEIPAYIAPLKFIGGMLFTIWSVYALMRTRENVRAKYSIPEERCNGCEDLCCSVWCSCCVVAQMARHTGEYETYKGSCCSETGMAAHAPTIV
ncbi:hypothetical protein HJC23_007153 [Cyclotella cryptica]|uniref:Uncharacterized protein n=1 Tax=Cyclotella cryptica TaxID=29204 RepID=A0ABD3QPS4_9STRA|eukprot:CCRYP_003402-RA/>CCRYP_003402-RA protein AED:0.03 eAED:0.03 QI:115/1/1/1/0.28/0.25/8/2144/258